MVFPALAAPIAAAAAPALAGAGATAAAGVGAAASGGVLSALLGGGGLSSLLAGGLGIAPLLMMGLQDDSDPAPAKSINDGAEKKEAMPANRTVKFPDGGFKHGIQPEHSFFESESGPWRGYADGGIVNVIRTAAQNIPDMAVPGMADGGIVMPDAGFKHGSAPEHDFGFGVGSEQNVAAPDPGSNIGADFNSYLRVLDMIGRGSKDTAGYFQGGHFAKDMEGLKGSLPGLANQIFGMNIPYGAGAGLSPTGPMRGSNSPRDFSDWGMADGGIVSIPGMNVPDPGAEDAMPGATQPDPGEIAEATEGGELIGIIEGAKQALMGKHPNPKEALTLFIQTFGEDALRELREDIVRGAAGETQGRMIEGPGAGRDDVIKGNIDGQQDVRLSNGEFVVPADVVSSLGDGATNSGAQRLHDMIERIRMRKNGSPAAPAAATPDMMPA